MKEWTWDAAWPAPAKLNLFLHVVGRRADGYHLLQTVFRFIDRCDTLHFAPRADGDIVLATPIPGVPPETDLTVRAARLLQQATGCRQGATIRLDKRLPMGGGLGGGSSDAATVLLALNHLWETGLDRPALEKLGLALGADVPVFVHGRNTFAEGVGESFTDVDLPAGQLPGAAARGARADRGHFRCAGTEARHRRDAPDRLAPRDRPQRPGNRRRREIPGRRRKPGLAAPPCAGCDDDRLRGLRVRRISVARRRRRRAGRPSRRHRRLGRGRPHRTSIGKKFRKGWTS
jgi:hypothetical protein